MIKLPERIKGQVKTWNLRSDYNGSDYQNSSDFTKRVKKKQQEP
jgi:hypothetical protein